MLEINTNINSLIAQQNLNGSGDALQQAITRLSSGKRINSAADDAAGLAIATTMQTQINGLDQGVQNANDGVSLVQTASSALGSITNSLQRIRQLATESASGTLTSSNQAALQQEVTQQVSEINRIASQTTFNGQNILNGSAGLLTFQVGANVGQTVQLNLSQNMSAAQLGGGVVQSGQTLGSIAVNETTAGVAPAAGTTGAITQINVVSDGNGGFTFTDQNNEAITSTAAVASVFSNAGITTGTNGAVELTQAAGATSGISLGAVTAAFTSTGVAAGADGAGVDNTTALTQLDAVNANATVSNLDISSVQGANVALVSIDNALNTVNNLQATLGASQNRFTAIASTQQTNSTDLSSAQSQIQNADFAQETASMSQAQVLQQAGISVLAQANSIPQQVLKLLG